MSSNSVSELKVAEKNEDVVVCSIENESIAGSEAVASTSFQLKASEEVVNKFIGVFSGDILPEIFDNLQILTASDLLHFRLVNRCWRDAATSILIKRNMCNITLDFGEVALDDDNNAFPKAMLWKLYHRKHVFKNILPGNKYFNFHKPSSFLSELCQLISTSPKFPSNNFCFRSSCRSGIESLCSTNELETDDDDDKDQNQKDLFQFFSLYGKKIRKLSLVSGISKKAVQNLLCVHLPHLVSLDLQGFEGFYYKDEETPDGIPSKVLSPSLSLSLENVYSNSTLLVPPLEIQEIFVGFNPEDCGEPNISKLNFVEELINISPNLTAIQNVDASSLELLLNLEKFHLIKSLHFEPQDEQMSTIKQLTQRLTDAILDDKLPSLQLSELTLEFSFMYDFYYEPHVVMKAINRIFITSKDSLRHLVIYNNSSKFLINLFIPPLPHLKCLRLVDYGQGFSDSDRTKFHFLGDAIGRAIQAGEQTADDESVDALLSFLQNPDSCNISKDYFPRLRTVILDLDTKETENNYYSHKLMGFFSTEQLGPDGARNIPGDTVLAVTTLKWKGFPPYYKNMSKLFPNVVRLEINLMGTPSNLQNWIWAAFPKLEIFQISGLNVKDNWDTTVMDSFFTGFSPELCSKLENATSSTELESSSSSPAVRFERTLPYIGDCENLKIFEIHFSNQLQSKFVSMVTALHGFQEVVQRKRTKIIFSCYSSWPSPEEIQETHHHLQEVAPYVEVRVAEISISYIYFL